LGRLGLLVRLKSIYCEAVRFLNVNAAPTEYFVSCCRHQMPVGREAAKLPISMEQLYRRNGSFVTLQIWFTLTLVLPLFVPLRRDFADHVVNAPLVLLLLLLL
jgi:hypothetical protein